MDGLLRQCLFSIAQVMEKEGRTDALDTAHFLKAAARSAREADPVSNPDLDRDLAAIRSLLTSSPHPAAVAVAKAERNLGWGRNPVDDELCRNGGDLPFVVANLLGPDAIFPCERWRAGLYYQRPNTRYGLHSHAAVETYAILAGSALWTAGDTQRWVGPGDFIHHSTYLPHACEAGDQGMVALWRWSGDIGTESYRVHDGRDAFSS